MLGRTLFFAAVLFPLAAQNRYAASWDSLDARPVPKWFTDAKFGIFIHWGVYSVPAYAPPGAKGGDAYAEWYWNHLRRGPISKGAPNGTWHFHNRTYGEQFDYQNFAAMFRAELFDPAHWADAFENSGAKYVVLTSKHHEGFALWPSEHASKTWGRPWNALDTGPKRDVLGDLTAAVRAKGLRMGYYFSLYEWYNPVWLSDRKRYIREHMIPQFKDLVTRYQPAVLFADGEWDLPSAEWTSPDLLAWVLNESAAKDEVVLNDRWGKDSRHKHGGYSTTEYTAGLEGNNHPWEESRGMGRSYGYNRAERLSDYRTERELTLMLVDLVSRGGNLLLDIGPTGDGRIPVIMEERLRQMGSWLARNGEAIFSTEPWVRTRQWSDGHQPRLETGEFMTRYEVTDYIERRKPEQAIIEAFFTRKGNDVFAIVPRVAGESFRVRNATLPAGRAVRILGRTDPLPWKTDRTDIVITLPRDLPPEAAFAIRLPFLAVR
jgi:alpha-L-fucosidase